MKPSLIVLDGHAQETMPFDSSWKAHIHSLAHDALPLLALQITPLPLLGLAIERRRSEALQALLEMLRMSHANSSLALTWQTFFVTDGSMGESFLLIAHPTSSAPLRLRFEYLRHLPVLEAIAQTGQLAVAYDDEVMPVPLSQSALDLQEHLAKIRLSQPQ